MALLVVFAYFLYLFSVAESIEIKNSILFRLRGGKERTKYLPWQIYTRPRPEWTKNKRKNPKVGANRELIKERMRNYTKKLFGRSLVGPDGRTYLPYGDVYFGQRLRIKKNRTEMALALLNSIKEPEGTMKAYLEKVRDPVTGRLDRDREFKMSDERKLFERYKIPRMRRRRVKNNH
mmetsp:Transcript_1144/g.1598  ORF Transcript_1144/g.1598 Transcript_1144/m.1598 type:complete len:177 (+) Transcript_1144:73-603(+)